MWILLFFLFLVFAFYFIQRQNFKKNTDKPLAPPTSAKKEQTHSVVTDVEHVDTKTETQITQGEEPENVEKNDIDSSIVETEFDEKMLDYQGQLEELKKQFEIIKEWQLYDSQAALLWHKNNPIITVLCLTKFKKEKPNSLIYKTFYFNTDVWSWHGPSPKGAASEIKNELSRYFKEIT